MADTGCSRSSFDSSTDLALSSTLTRSASSCSDARETRLSYSFKNGGGEYQEKGKTKLVWRRIGMG